MVTSRPCVVLRREFRVPGDLTTLDESSSALLTGPALIIDLPSDRFNPVEEDRE